MTFFIIHHFQESRHQLVSLPTLPIKSVGESFFNNFFTVVCFQLFTLLVLLLNKAEPICYSAAAEVTTVYILGRKTGRTVDYAIFVSQCYYLIKTFILQYNGSLYLSLTPKFKT